MPEDMSSEGNRLHRTLRELKIPRTPESLAQIALEIVPDAIGAAVIDLDADSDHALLHMATEGDHPDEIMAMLPAAMHEIVAGPTTTAIIDAWEERYNRRSEVDDLRFTTGPLSHYAARLHSNPGLMLAVVVPVTTNPRVVLLNLGRMVELAVIEDRWER